MKDVSKMTKSEQAIYYEMFGHRFETASNVLRNQIDRLEELKTRVLNEIDALINSYDNLANANFNEVNDYFEIVKNIEAEMCEPEITITPAERDFLKGVSLAVDSKDSYVAREQDSKLCIYPTKPEKSSMGFWLSTGGGYMYIRPKLFPFIKWEDKEPWSFEDLMKLPVKER